ncbi:MAG: type II secretion system protein GspC [Candidatus Binatia bacterium]
MLVGGQLVLLAMGAFFTASAVNSVIAMRLMPPLDVKVEPAPASDGAKGVPPISRYAAITERDVFNPPRAVEASAPSAPVTSPLNARLLGTAPGHGIDSYAVLEDGSTRKQELFRLGDRFQDRTIARIEWDHVILSIDGREEMLKLAEPATGAPAPPTSTASAGDLAGGIRAISETSFQIDRSEVDKAMENLNQLFTQVRAVPHFQDGKAAGFRLFAIRRDSIFEKLGLKNGDIISRINGNELTDPARAMSLMQELRGEGNVNVEVSRNRQPVTLGYEIR